MARYIDADELLKHQRKMKGCGISLDDAFWDYAVLSEDIKNAPTADVVPKSEVDALISAVDNSTKEFLKLHDAYQEQKTDIERIKDDNEYLQDKVFKVRLEVAREIFEEIEEIDEDTVSFQEFYSKIMKLKKKYTEQKND